MARYVVAGVTGRVGSIVAAELLTRGHTPLVIVRDGKHAQTWLERRSDIAIGSLDDATFLSGLLRGAAGFFVLLPENIGSDDFHGARRRMADAITEGVGLSGVPHVVMLSAVAAVLPDGNGPAKDLHYLEHRLRDATMLTALRASYFQDNIASMIPPARHAGIYPNLLPSDDVPFPMIATSDVGRFAADALMNPPSKSEVVDLLGPPYSVRDMAAELGAALGRTLQIVNVPPSEHVATLVGAGVSQQLAEAVAEMLVASGSGRIVPRGDRQLVGTTTLAEVIAACVEGTQAAAS